MSCVGRLVSDEICLSTMQQSLSNRPHWVSVCSLAKHKEPGLYSETEQQFRQYCTHTQGVSRVHLGDLKHPVGNGTSEL